MIPVILNLDSLPILLKHPVHTDILHFVYFEIFKPVLTNHYKNLRGFVRCRFLDSSIYLLISKKIGKTSRMMMYAVNSINQNSWFIPYVLSARDRMSVYLPFSFSNVMQPNGFTFITSLRLSFISRRILCRKKHSDLKLE